ncbi:protein of unknown function [Maridesulfovibrio hydrothermalis AM13 = DSM 14728]|uniref:Uncharacterized protein n=1 Tax=Maridesulfovibrio hydrothermalis AM13 = DSM 14728 TaxID=1121451 RepID=L0R6V9_9BACT|nr:protein of unknown function [Maridesulfovibrio hydrothermalis AM13 = DSM 14728]
MKDTAKANMDTTKPTNKIKNLRRTVMKISPIIIREHFEQQPKALTRTKKLFRL